MFNIYRCYTWLCRQLSPQRRSTENERGWRHGLLINAPFVDCILPKAQNFSMIRATTESYMISLNMPRGALRSLGNDLRSLWFSLLTISSLSMPTYLNSTHGLLCSRLRELHTLKGHVESVVKLKGLDIETIQQHYTVWMRNKEFIVFSLSLSLSLWRGERVLG